MAFVREKLSPVGAFADNTPGSGFSVWSYTSPDGGATIRAAGYFNTARDILSECDILLTTQGTESGNLSRAFVMYVINQAPDSPSTTDVTVKAKFIASSA